MTFQYDCAIRASRAQDLILVAQGRVKVWLSYFSMILISLGLVFPRKLLYFAPKIISGSACSQEKTDWRNGEYLKPQFRRERITYSIGGSSARRVEKGQYERNCLRCGALFFRETDKSIVYQTKSMLSPGTKQKLKFSSPLYPTSKFDAAKVRRLIWDL